MPCRVIMPHITPICPRLLSSWIVSYIALPFPPQTSANNFAINNKYGFASEADSKNDPYFHPARPPTIRSDLLIASRATYLVSQKGSEVMMNFRSPYFALYFIYRIHDSCHAE